MGAGCKGLTVKEGQGHNNVMANRKKNMIRINRRVKPGQYGLTDVFTDICSYGILRAIFDDAKELERVMKHTKVFIVGHPHVMSVDNGDGSINIGLEYLKSASDEFLYLDIIHELCHVKQHLEGRNLYDRHKTYVDRETEIEAYEVTVQEARRIGLTDSDICNYLHVSWITPEEHKRLVRRLGCGRKQTKKQNKRPPSI